MNEDIHVNFFFFLRMFTTPCNSAGFSRRALDLESKGWSSQGSTVTYWWRNMSSLPQFFFHERTGFLIKNKDKILVTKKMYDYLRYEDSLFNKLKCSSTRLLLPVLIFADSKLLLLKFAQIINILVAKKKCQVSHWPSIY